MILDKNTQNIKYIGLNQGDITGVRLKDYIILANLGEWLPYEVNVYGWHWDGSVGLGKADGIYLGETIDIKSKINSKINPNSPETFKKVYFDPNCTYPRFKLNALTNIKRCLDPSKADSVIITTPSFIDYNTHARVTLNKVDKVLILYSKTEDCYYLLDYCPDKLPDSKRNTKFQGIFSKYANTQCIGLHKWASALINDSVLPSDCVEFYFGRIVLTKSPKETQLLKDLTTNYMLLTYDTELDRFISNGLQKMTAEDIETINRMLSSTDSSVVGMGLKLLSNYDILDSACSIGVLIVQNWRFINSCSVSKSVAFKQILSLLELDVSTLHQGSIEEVVKTIYKKSTNEEDKDKVRNLIKQRCEQVILNKWNILNAEICKDLGITFKFTIE